jgi:hypothetical protein
MIEFIISSVIHISGFVLGLYLYIYLKKKYRTLKRNRILKQHLDSLETEAIDFIMEKTVFVKDRRMTVVHKAKLKDGWTDIKVPTDHAVFHINTISMALDLDPDTSWELIKNLRLKGIWIPYSEQYEGIAVGQLNPLYLEGRK